ncbi:MAG TPA: cupin domain-containing protein [Burkholderiales bacterium]|nr:cupin domain-containing protein [Burkholderiales bacterium]
MLKLPALDSQTVEERRGSGYPEPFKSRMGDRAKRRLGAACGLKNLGVNLVTLGPGGQSALRHWHTLEDEFVYVLEGEVVLVTNEGEQTLRPGMCAGYPAGSKNGHHFINRSHKPAKYLEMGTNVPGDTAFYPDDDLRLFETEDAGMVYARKDGRRY